MFWPGAVFASKPLGRSYLCRKGPRGAGVPTSEETPGPEHEPKWPELTWAVLTLLAAGAAIVSGLWP